MAVGIHKCRLGLDICPVDKRLLEKLHQLCTPGISHTSVSCSQGSTTLARQIRTQTLSWVINFVRAPLCRRTRCCSCAKPSCTRLERASPPETAPRQPRCGRADQAVDTLSPFGLLLIPRQDRFGSDGTRVIRLFGCHMPLVQDVTHSTDS